MENGKKKTGGNVTRRDFLKGLSGGAVGTALAPKLLAQDASSLQTKKGNIPVYSKKKVTLTVNGKQYFVNVDPRDTLLHVLRERLNLTGAKRTCDRGECGACTVILDGDPVYSCMFLAIRADGKKVATIEGLATDKGLHPAQQAFIKKDAYQCGFCTPGFVMSSVSLLKKNKNPNLDEIKMGLSGNICRCGNFSRIYEAVSEAASNMRRT